MKLTKLFVGVAAIACLVAAPVVAQPPDPSNAGVVSGASGWSISSTGYLNYTSSDSRGFPIAGGSSVSVSLSGTYSGVTIVEEQTNDVTGQTGWYTVACEDVTSSGVTFNCPVLGVRHRIRVSAYTSGTVVARVVLRQASPLNMSTSGCIGATGGFFVNGTAGTRLSVACTTTGAIGIAANSPSGGFANLTISGANISSAASQALSVEEAGRSFSNITTNATTTVKSGAGFLHTLCINTKGASANTATIYDNTAASGTKIGTVDTTSGVGCQTFDIRFGTGLTIVTATGTAADITVSYR